MFQALCINQALQIGGNTWKILLCLSLCTDPNVQRLCRNSPSLLSYKTETHLGCAVMSSFVFPLVAIAGAPNLTVIGCIIALGKGHKHSHYTAVQWSTPKPKNTFVFPLAATVCFNSTVIVWTSCDTCIDWDKPYASHLHKAREKLATSTSWWMQSQSAWAFTRRVRPPRSCSWLPLVTSGKDLPLLCLGTHAQQLSVFLSVILSFCLLPG